MKKIIIVAAGILLSSSAVLMNAQKTAGNSGPSLKETTSWIQDTMFDGTYHEFKSPYSNDASYVGYSSADFNTCTMSITEWTTYENGRKEKTSIIIPLAALDPSTISSSKVAPARAFVFFATTNNKDLIAVTLPNGRSDPIYSTYIVTQESYAPRFTAALKHLVVLCGGQKSPF